MGMTGAIVAVSVGVLLPVLLATSVGIIAIILGSSTQELVIGVLVISFAAAATGGGIVAVVLMGRRARVARMQSDLLANVSHELRTPLAAVRMYAQTLQSGLLEGEPETRDAAINEIVRETERLDATIERVLSWRTLAQDREALAMEIEPIQGAIQKAVARFQRMTSPDEVNLTLDLSSDLPVRHDCQAISSIVLNLLVNSLKYTGNDKQIALTTRDCGDHVEISVADNGIGIPQREVGRIFDPFHRGKSRQARQVPGAGLGLAIVMHLTSDHGGSIVVESEEQMGSTFTVRLPAAGQGSER
jgi:two-component system phosphate regulon sensor histidine kinase PhoR